MNPAEIASLFLILTTQPIRSICSPVLPAPIEMQTKRAALTALKGMSAQAVLAPQWPAVLDNM